MPFVEILCPNGHRVKVELTPNTKLIKALEEACAKKGFNPEEHVLRHNRKAVDLALAFRLTGITNNAKLEMVPISGGSQPADTEVLVALRLDGGVRLEGTFSPDTSLWDIMMKLAEANIDARQMIFKSDESLHPVIVNVSEEIVGETSLRMTRLRSLGLIRGRTLFQLVHRRVDPGELAAIEARMQSVPVSERRTTSRTDSQPVEMHADQVPTTEEVPSGTVISGGFYGSSIFDDSRARVREQEQQERRDHQRQRTQARTLGGILGIDLSADLNPIAARHTTQDFSDFKFPEETAGKAVYQNEFIEVSREEFMPCDRENVVYSVDQVTGAAPTESDEALPDDFFELSEQDVRKLIVSYQKEQQALAEAPLLTHSMRETMKEAMFEKYPRAILQFNFPDKTVLQSVFKPRESVQSLYSHVRDSLQNRALEFSLYTTPPKVILKDRTKNLMQVDLLPMAKVYVSFNSSDTQSVHDPYLNESLMQTLNRGNIMEARNIVVKYMSGMSTSPVGLPSQGAASSSGTQRPPQGASGSAAAKIPKWFKPSK